MPDSRLIWLLWDWLNNSPVLKTKGIRDFPDALFKRKRDCVPQRFLTII